VFIAIAIHHAQPEHVEAFLDFMSRVRQATAHADGLIDFTSWRDTQSGRLVAMSRWEAQDAFSAALPLIMSLSDQRRAEWSERPDELMLLVEP
jgi:quinol monooxygenase YgiN